MPTDRSEQSRPDAIDFIADGDPFDHFPWTVTLYSEEFQDLPGGHRKAFISTPNGKRIDNGGAATLGEPARADRDEVARMTETWHVVHSADLLSMLRRCRNGEDPEMVYLEAYVNAEPVENSDGE